MISHTPSSVALFLTLCVFAVVQCDRHGEFKMLMAVIAVGAVTWEDAQPLLEMQHEITSAMQLGQHHTTRRTRQQR